VAAPDGRGRDIAAIGRAADAGGLFRVCRRLQGSVFCLFFFFEQFLPIATYMADARAQDLPLLTVGDSDDVIHDWNYLFGRFGVLEHDTQIAHAMRILGWAGMLATVAWIIYRSVQSNGDATTDEHG
jgi:hypothetical protein